VRPYYFVVIGTVVGVLIGCYRPPVSKPLVQEKPKAAKVYATSDLIVPDGLPYSTARLILAGKSLPVEMSRVKKGDSVDFNLVCKKEVLEVEHFQSDDKSFRFAGLSDEAFVPPIPLVRYPFTVGETWDWAGTAGLGPNTKQATAGLLSSEETINLSGGVNECVLVTANLVVETPGGTNSKRTLKFWIQPMKGVVKREFGFSSTREPRPAGSP